MRMWMVDPKILCRKHLLGEHVELHMLVGSIKRNRSIDGFVRDGLISTQHISSRHTALVQEMKARGYNHQSPLVYRDTLKRGSVNVGASVDELRRRCAACKALQDE